MKKTFLILYIFICLMSIACIPINLFLWNMPEWIMLVFGCGIIFLTALLLRQKGKKVLKFFAVLFTVLVVSVSLFGSYCNPYWNSLIFKSNVDYHSESFDGRLSSREALKDLDYAMKYLKKLHPVFYKGMPQDIKEKYENIRKKMKQSDEFTVHDLNQDIEAIFSMIGDGHTFVLGNYSDNRYLKNNVEWERDNCRLIAVNKKTVEQLLVEKADIYSFDAPSWERELMAFDLISVYGLRYLGFSLVDGVEYTYETEDGKRNTIICSDEDFVSSEEYQALSSGEEDGAQEFVRYELDEEKSLAVLTLDECIYNDEYTDCIKEMFTKIKKKGIHNVAVHLRNNGGGDDSVAFEFIKYLNTDSYHCMTYQQRLGIFQTPLSDSFTENERYESLTFDGQLYILTSESTFSSAMAFAQYIKDNQLGILIGESPGNDPNGYGEVAAFQLPNSKLCMQISTKQFYRADRDCEDAFVLPDITCDSDKAKEKLNLILN